MSVLPVPPFGPRTQTSRLSLLALAAARRSAVRRAIALLMTNAELLLRLREQRHVGGSDVERPAQEAVRRRRGEDDDR